MVTERDVISEFLAFRSDYVTPEENINYSRSLDCALATMVECEKRGIDYPTSYERLRTIVQEKGEFWNSCIEEAVRLYQGIDLSLVSNMLLIKEKAICLGVQRFIDGFTEGM
jgi:hypothetical protein